MVSDLTGEWSDVGVKDVEIWVKERLADGCAGWRVGGYEMAGYGCRLAGGWGCDLRAGGVVVRATDLGKEGVVGIVWSRVGG